jgi:tetratricopeptide (TPR) repeat protein
MNDDSPPGGRLVSESNLMEAIEEARTLRRADELEASQDLLLDLLSQFPNHPLVLFEVGGSYDVMGEEEMAIPYYRQAIGAGLDGNDLQECLVCLGSTLRVVGEHEDAVTMLEQAVDEFPERNSGRAFLALAYYSNGEVEKSISLLMSLLLETTSDDDIIAYADTLDYYKDNLDETVDG